MSRCVDQYYLGKLSTLVYTPVPVLYVNYHDHDAL